jgi:hypothetical protein
MHAGARPLGLTGWTLLYNRPLIGIVPLVSLPAIRPCSQYRRRFLAEILPKCLDGK